MLSAKAERRRRFRRDLVVDRPGWLESVRAELDADDPGWKTATFRVHGKGGVVLDEFVLLVNRDAVEWDGGGPP